MTALTAPSLALSVSGGKRGMVATIDLGAEQIRQIGMHARLSRARADTQPVQYDWAVVGSTGELAFIIPDDWNGEDFLLSPASGAAPAVGMIGVTTIKDYEGQETYRIDTPAARFYYHKQGAGFASIIDADGRDWLSFRPWGGSDGIYRGIPNLAHPENHFHPGAANGMTDAVRLGPIRAVLTSRSKDGKWACRWDVFPSFVRLTVTAADHPFWVLYEGTPAGKLEPEQDFCAVSDGRRRPLTQRWEEVLPEPKWIYFGKTGVERVLFLADHTNRTTIDSFWPMEGNMTVFGFGRNGQAKFLKELPYTVTIGIVETSDHDRASSAIAAAMAEPIVTVKEGALT